MSKGNLHAEGCPIQVAPIARKSRKQILKTIRKEAFPGAKIDIVPTWIAKYQGLSGFGMTEQEARTDLLRALTGLKGRN